MTQLDTLNRGRSVQEYIDILIWQEMQRIRHETTNAEIQINSAFDYDLIVIGGGTEGAAAAKQASKLGKRVAICDFTFPTSIVKSWGWRVGGSCVNVGCVPKMLMHQSGLIGEYLDKRTSLPFGWFAPESEKNFAISWSTLVDNIQSHIRTLNYERQFGLSYYKGIKYFNTHCEFEGSHTILLTHEDKRMEYITGEV